MPWLVISARSRALYVRGAEAGHPTFTREAELALRFDGQDAARKWIDRHTYGRFGELALQRCSTTPKQKSPNEGSRGSKGKSHGKNTTIPAAPAD